MLGSEKDIVVFCVKGNELSGYMKDGNVYLPDVLC
jgi:hypothetical protein